MAQFPDILHELIDDGTVTRVLRQLKSGKEASVYVVEADGEICAAKIYKRAESRNFRQRQDYVEGRQTGESRTQRAMDRGSRFGKTKQEEAWQNAEADAMFRLHAAGVRIPRPIANLQGAVLMDLVCDEQGEVAPQIAAGRYSRQQAIDLHRAIIDQVAAMLRADLIHADLSEFNILAAAGGPTIIDLPQAVDAAKNSNAKRLLVRDVANVTRFCARFAPELRRTDYGNEMWILYENQALRADTRLTGKVKAARSTVDTFHVMQAIEDAKREAAERATARERRERPR